MWVRLDADLTLAAQSGPPKAVNANHPASDRAWEHPLTEVAGGGSKTEGRRCGGSGLRPFHTAWSRKAERGAAGRAEPAARNSTISTGIQRSAQPHRAHIPEVTMSKSRSQAANDRVESNRQARTYDATKLHYQRLGLCRFCAAQGAWGHQLGFSRVNPPCHECQPLVNSFPVTEPGAWKSYSPRRGAMFSFAVSPRTGQQRSQVRNF